MRIDVAGFVPMVGRDAYVGGRGRMRGTLLRLVTVADGSGEEFDVSELVTCLNDAVMLAPSMLLAPDATFTPVDDTSFDVSLTDAGRTVSARVFLDAAGHPIDFRTSDRFADLPGGLRRAEWSTPLAGWHTVAGRALPRTGAAVWKLADGDLSYLEFVFDDDAVSYNPSFVPSRAERAVMATVDSGTDLMNDHSSRGFWVTNHLANPVLEALLRSPVGRRTGRHLALLRYRGRRTGQQHELVVQYARDGQQVWVVPGQPDRKTWWRNLREPSTIEVRLAGHDYHGSAVALDGREHPDDVHHGLTVYLRELPRARKALGLRANPGTDRETDLADTAEGTVIVRIELDAGAQGTSQRAS